MKRKFRIALFGLIFVLITFFTTCEYSNVESKFPNCDTVNVSYSKVVKPILATNCYRCHGTNSNDNSGGIDLENYDILKIFAGNGYLYGDIAQLPFPYHAMPPDGGKLSNCEIIKIKAWINLGYPNN